MRCSFVKKSSKVVFLSSTCISVIFFLCTLLLMLCYDVHPNPGPGSRTVNLCHINIRSLTTDKLDAIDTALSNLCDIITLSETYLTATSDVSALKLNGFKPIECLNRIGRIGGGVALYVKQYILAERKKEYELNGLEAMWHELRICNKRLLLCTCYRPPNVGVDFWDRLSESLELARQSTTNDILIIGDLNADPNAYHGTKLKEFSDYNCMHINVHEPTRITSHSSTILDQIVSSRPNLVSNINIEPPVSTIVQ